MSRAIPLTLRLDSEIGWAATHDEHAARCAYMTAWLTEHEGDDLSITVRPCLDEGVVALGRGERGRPDGLRVRDRGADVLRGRRIDVLTEDRVTTEHLEGLIQRAIEASSFHPSDDEVRALGVEAGAAGDTATAELARAALEMRGARHVNTTALSKCYAIILQARARAMAETVDAAGAV